MQKIARVLTEKWIWTLLATILLSLIPYCHWLSLILMSFMSLCLIPAVSVLFFLAAALPPLFKWYFTAHYFMWLLLLTPAFTWLVAVVLRHYRSWSMVLDFTLATVLAVTLVLLTIFPDIESLWLQMSYSFINYISGTLTQSHSYFITQLNTVIPLVPSWLQFTNYLRNIAFFDFFPLFFTSIIVTGVLLNLLGYVLIAQLLVKTADNSPKLSEQLRSIRLYPLLSLAFVFIIIGTYAHLPQALQLIYGIAFIYFLAGLSVYHWVMQRFSPVLSWLGIIILYFLLIISPWGTASVLIVLAFTDSLLNIRRCRFKRERGRIA